MRKLILCLLLIFFFGSTFINKAKAEKRSPLIDSTNCCTPDSLRVISVTDSIFCVRWHVKTDSNCTHPQAFEIHWKLRFGSVWKTKTITYTSGNIIDFCDTVDCGVNIWEVRTKCNDSTYSDWVPGNKFTILCGPGFPLQIPKPSIFSNQESNAIYIPLKVTELECWNDKRTLRLLSVIFST